MKDLETIIGYTFKDKNILKRALTHTSYANEARGAAGHNERMEFLGDSVLSLIVSDYLFNAHKQYPEGELTRIRAGLVCEEALFTYAKEINLGQFLYLGKGEEANGGRERASICSDAFEALLAGIYLDGGYPPAKKFVLRFVRTEELAGEDYKTTLQEVVQKNPGERLRYVLADETGPDHKKEFTVEVHLNSNVIGTGVGSSKKAAEQKAAKEALKLMGL